MSSPTKQHSGAPQREVDTTAFRAANEEMAEIETRLSRSPDSKKWIEQFNRKHRIEVRP